MSYDNKNNTKRGSKGTKNRGNRNSFPKKKDSDRDYDVKEAGSVAPHNSPAWYTKNAALANDAASIPFNLMLGAPIDRSFNPFDYSRGNESLPGVMTISVNAVPGSSDDAASPINIMATRNYSEIRYKNSGSTNYQSSDLAMYMLAMDQAYALWSYAVRAYGVAMQYSPFNRYYPEAILKGMGLNADTVVADLANLRYAIRVYATKLNSLAVPDNMDYYRRHVYLYANLFIDHESEKAQTYMFVPECFFRYNQKKYDTGGCLEYTHWWLPGETTHTCSELIDLLNNFVDDIWTDEAFNVMSGDILKYTGSKLFSVEGIPEDFKVARAYDPAILEQINNAVAVGVAKDHAVTRTDSEGNTSEFDSRDIYQHENSVFYNPYFDGLVLDDWMLNMHTLTPTPSDVLYATRLTAIPTTRDSSGMVNYQFATDQVVSFAIFQYSNVGGKWVPAWYGTKDSARYTNYLHFNAEDYSDATAMVTMLQMIRMTNFDWHPRVHVVYTDSKNGDTYILPSIGDVTNVALLDAATLKKMNVAAMMSILDVTGHFDLR